MKYNGESEFTINVAGLTRKLPIIEIKKGRFWIASFVMLGDTELNLKCAQELIKKFPHASFDRIIIPEAKALPLAQAICQLLSEGKSAFKNYIVLRKSIKAYMQNHLTASVKSITTAEKQVMVIDGKDVKKIKGKTVFLIDDVLSTGGSFKAMIELVKKAGARIGFAGVVLKEGEFDVSNIEKELGMPIAFLEKLPVFEKT